MHWKGGHCTRKTKSKTISSLKKKFILCLFKFFEVFHLNIPAPSWIHLMSSLSLYCSVHILFFFSGHVLLPYNLLPFWIKTTVFCVITCSVIVFNFYVFSAIWVCTFAIIWMFLVLLKSILIFSFRANLAIAV